MKRKLQLEIKKTRALTPDVHLLTLVLDAEAAADCRPGQFFNLQPLDSTAPLLRRPISICDARADEMDLLIQVVGDGTRLLVQRRPGATLDAVGPLGTTFEADPSRPSLMIAGGVGVAPLHYLAQSIRRESGGKNAPITFCYGARNADGFVLLDELGAVADSLVLTTEDGSKGEQGYVTTHAAPFMMPDTQIFVCGPSPMMNAALGLMRERGVEGFLSLENQMGCGVGSCQGCVVPTRKGMLRVCCEGPVVDSRLLDSVMSE